MGSKLVSLVLAAYVLTALNSRWAQAAQTVGAADIEVTVAGNSMSVIARNAPLRSVLLEIGEKTGIATALRGDLSVNVYRSLIDVPIDVGVRRLAGDAGLVIRYDPKQPGRVVEVRVYGEEGGGEKAAMDTTVKRTPPDKDKLVRALLSSRSTSARVQGIEIARELGPAKAVRLLEPVLRKDSDPAVRKQAAANLARVRSDEAIKALENGLTDTEAEVRTEVVRALGAVGGNRANNLVAKAMLSDKDPAVRLAAIRTFSTRNDTLKKAVLEKASRDTDEKVSQTARNALQRLQ